MGILIPLKLTIRIQKLAVVTIQGRHYHPLSAALPPSQNSTGHPTEKAITFYFELRLQ